MTYNTLISACGKAGKYSEALEVAAAMRARGHVPDSFTICSLVAAGGSAGEWRSALATFQDFCAAGGRPNTAAYNALVRGRLINAMQRGGMGWETLRNCVHNASEVFSENSGLPHMYFLVPT